MHLCRMANVYVLCANFRYTKNIFVIWSHYFGTHLVLSRLFLPEPDSYYTKIFRARRNLILGTQRYFATPRPDFRYTTISGAPRNPILGTQRKF